MFVVAVLLHDRVYLIKTVGLETVTVESLLRNISIFAGWFFLSSHQIGTCLVIFVLCFFVACVSIVYTGRLGRTVRTHRLQLHLLWYWSTYSVLYDLLLHLILLYMIIVKGIGLGLNGGYDQKYRKAVIRTNMLLIVMEAANKKERYAPSSTETTWLPSQTDDEVVVR